MKFMHMFSIGVLQWGDLSCWQCSAANTAQGHQISDSTLVAQAAIPPGGTGSGSTGRMESGNAGAGMSSGSTDPGRGTGDTYPEKARPGMGMDPGTRGTTGSSSGMTGSSAGTPSSSSGPMGSPSSGMSGSGK